MKQHGVVIPKGLDLQFSEVGIGGRGRSEKLVEIGMAKEPSEAARAPWAGTGDPKQNPWTSPTLRSVRRDFHQALLEFLRIQPADWHVSAAFLWNTGSWCPYGFDNPVFADAEIVSMIQRSNLRAAPRSAAARRLPK